MYDGVGVVCAVCGLAYIGLSSSFLLFFVLILLVLAFCLAFTDLVCVHWDLYSKWLLVVVM